MDIKFAAFFLSTLCWSQVGLAAEPLRYAASSAWAMPYGKFEADHLTGGILYDLAQALGTSMGMPVSIVVLPRKRIDGAVLAGDVDVRCYTNPQWTAVPDEHLWSKNLFDITEVIFGGASVANPKNLQYLTKGVGISTVLGYEYQGLNPLFASGELRRDDAVDQEKVLMKLSLGRTPYGVSDALALQWYVKSTPLHHLANWRVTLSRNDFLCGVPKKGRVQAARILGALEDLKKSGKIDEILRNYR
jgi:polar amino acid transport system substrate-binding protein